MAEVRQLARRAAQSDNKTLITGESGVGKDLIAREIHCFSRRAGGPYVPVNCAGLTDTLLESELFGHAKGSFTGAYRDHRGKLQSAHGGTLFLDEVGEMSLRMQAVLLRFLESGEIQRVGDTQIGLRVDTRIVAATNRQLEERVAAGAFREDLLYRLKVIHIHVPPLRQRPDDIDVLIAHFLNGAPRPVSLSEEARQVLLRYAWPGNVRELQNIIEQAVWAAADGTIQPSHIPEAVRRAPGVTFRGAERRRTAADELFELLLAGRYSFWDHVHPLFLARDLTREDLRHLIARGLTTTHGSYRALLPLFGMPPEDYYRFHNFLDAHSCKVDFRPFRSAAHARTARRALPTAS